MATDFNCLSQKEKRANNVFFFYRCSSNETSQRDLPRAQMYPDDRDRLRSGRRSVGAVLQADTAHTKPLQGQES